MLGLWVDARAALVLTLGPLNALRHERLPLVVTALEQVARFGNELVVTATTRADAEAQPATTTLARLSLLPWARSRAVTRPLRVPLAGARVVPMVPPRLLLWSPDDEAAHFAVCPPGP